MFTDCVATPDAFFGTMWFIPFPPLVQNFVQCLRTIGLFPGNPCTNINNNMIIWLQFFSHMAVMC